MERKPRRAFLAAAAGLGGLTALLSGCASGHNEMGVTQVDENRRAVGLRIPLRRKPRGAEPAPSDLVPGQELP